jgi:hypothetical protein
METDRSYTEKLSTMYANYFDAWRALFGVPDNVGAPTPLEEREVWEGEGGRQ